MPKPTKGSRLGATPKHQEMMLNGMASQLIVHERIRTTETKAKRLRPVAEKLITLGKDGSVHARRRALGMIEDREVIHKLFADVAPRFADRNGGYTRVLKLGTRQGDAAPMAIIELVEGAVESTPSQETEQKRRRGLRRRKPAKAAQAEPESEQSDEDQPEPNAGAQAGTEAEAAKAAEPVAEAEPAAEVADEAIVAAEPAAEAEGVEATVEPVAEAEPAAEAGEADSGKGKETPGSQI